ncbi:unnamed protein product [Schistosoma spindalis]|nr:unnamed protein product [Schistosoma spindale]
MGWSPLSLVSQYSHPFSKELSCYVFVQWKFITLSPTRQPFRCAGIKKKKNYAETPSRYRPSVLVKTLRGFQFNDGDYVYKGDILVRQSAGYTLENLTERFQFLYHMNYFIKPKETLNF